MEDLNLPWMIEQGPLWDVDYCYLKDSKGNNIATIYAIHSNNLVPLIKHLLEKVNADVPKPEELPKSE